MENTLQFFNYEDKPVRTVQIDNDPWFVLKDVCDILDLTSPHKVAERLDEDERNQVPVIDNLGRYQETTIINESGLYNVIVRSDKPEAKAFKRWVTHEVLPSIRKHGAYMTPGTMERALTDPDFLISLATQLKTEKQKNLALQTKNAELATYNQIMTPKAEYFDELVDRNLLTNFRETAKQLEIKEKTFMDFLTAKKYIYRDKRGKILPYADKNNGLFEIKESFNEKTNWSGTQTLITPKGRETFRLLMHN